jgi:predicted ATP-grasp superfamily ATP-dependent carboligase
MTNATSKAQRPVVLLGGLNIVRALGLAKIPVIIASSDRRTPSMASRYCAATLELPPLGTDAPLREAVVETLTRAGRRLAAQHGAPVPLFYDNDDRLALVQDYRAALAPHFALLLNEPALGDALLDKSLFQALAERRGLPVPRRIDWDALDAQSGPVLVKPKLRTAWEHSIVLAQLFGGVGKARVFDSGREARASVLVQQLAGQLAFQEYVPGGDDAIWSFHGFAAPGGELLEWFVGRKIRTFPALTGDSSYLRLAHDDGLAALGRDIAARLPLAGIFKMDFKRSAATGRFYLLEINTRFNLWHYLGARNGVNLARVAYEFLTQDRRPEKSNAQTRYRWLSLGLDWRAYRELRARRALSLAAWLLSLARAPKVYDLFAWTDPLPFARYWSARLRRVPHGLTRRFSRWLSTAS